MFALPVAANLAGRRNNAVAPRIAARAHERLVATDGTELQLGFITWLTTGGSHSGNPLGDRLIGEQVQEVHRTTEFLGISVATLGPRLISPVVGQHVESGVLV